MDRRALLGSGVALPLAAWALPSISVPRTEWRIAQSEGLDALVFLGPLSGNAIHTPFYGEHVDSFRSRMSSARLEELDVFSAEASAAGRLLGPTLAVLASGAEDRSIDSVLKSLASPEHELQSQFEASAYASRSVWDWFVRRASSIAGVVMALEDAGFSAWRAERLNPLIERRRPQLATTLSTLDVISEQERLLGTRLEPQIEVCLMLCVAPFAIKVQGQRFLAHAGYPDSKIVLAASHEMLHPPLPPGSRAEVALLEMLRTDTLTARVVRDHDPSFGYNSLEGLANEDLVQALDQVVQERIGLVDKPAAARWRDADGGMHLLAAGFYGLMQSTGYTATGGNLADWTLQCLADGRLTVDRLHQESSALLGFDVRTWTP